MVDVDVDVVQSLGHLGALHIDEGMVCSSPAISKHSVWENAAGVHGYEKLQASQRCRTESVKMQILCSVSLTVLDGAGSLQ